MIGTRSGELFLSIDKMLSKSSLEQGSSELIPNEEVKTGIVL